MKLVASVLVIILLLGISANTAAYAQQVITPQGLQQVQPQPQPISTVQSQPQPQVQVQNAVIDLNTPILQSSNSTLNSSLLSNNNCFNGVVVYQTSLITNQPVPVCVTSDMMNSQLLNAWGQLFNIDFTVKSDNDNNDDDDRNDKNHRGNHHNGNTPDGNCLFNPSLPKCAPDNGECPKGFNQNEDGNCFPAHPEGCPNDYHGVDNDETGKCIKDSEGCPDGMEFRPDGKTCTYKQEDPKPVPVPVSHPVSVSTEDTPSVDDATNNKLLEHLENTPPIGGTWGSDESDHTPIIDQTDNTDTSREDQQPQQEETNNEDTSTESSDGGDSNESDADNGDSDGGSDNSDSGSDDSDGGSEGSDSGDN